MLWKIKKNWICPEALLIICCLLLPAASAGGENERKAEKAAAPRGLDDIGMALEEARRLAPPAMRKASGSVAQSLRAFMETDYGDDQRMAVNFLYGEIQFALGNFSEAAGRFDEARRKDGDKLYRDDAAAAEIIAMEAQGRDRDATDEWVKWEKKYENSPLTQEVYVARVWNALRRGQKAEALYIMKELDRRFPWMKSDRRVILARSVIAYLEKRYHDALEQLAGAGESAGSIYLAGLAHQKKGEMLKAAARYREVAERYVHSPLRDPALLAKANIFLSSRSYKSAAEEMERVVADAERDDIRAEAMFRGAAAVYLDGRPDEGAEMLRRVVAVYPGSDVGARAQFLLGEILFERQLYQDAINEFNRVLAEYFDHNLAPRAQYRIGRSLDALGRGADAISTYQAVVAGYPLAPESPAAAYLAGVGLLELDRPVAAAPYFQIVLDRYAGQKTADTLVFADREHRELVEASLCLLELSYHRAGNLGQLSGAPHMMLQKMPPSSSPWRANALLIDADAMAAQARYPEAEKMLKRLIDEFPENAIAVPATRLLAWTYARQGLYDLAIETEESILKRYAGYGESEDLSLAYFNRANILFNRKEYADAGAAYDEFLRRYSLHPKRLEALYRAGLCYQRIDQNGDAVDRWEALVEADSCADIAEQAWIRAGDLYFRAEHYEEAQRCYGGLLANFSGSSAASLGTLRLAQCAYNSGNDQEALKLYSRVITDYPGSAYAREAERGMEQSLYRLGQRDDGATVLKELVERYPNSSFAADAQFEIGMRSYQAQDYQTAAEEFRRVITQFPDFSAADRAHYLMADAYRQAGLAREAGLAYQQFLTFFPESEFRPMVYFHLGSIRFETGEYMHAAIDFTGVLDEEAPEDISAAALYNLALCRSILGEPEEAARLLQQYRREYSDSDQRAADIAYQLAVIHFQTGRNEQAVEEYGKALAAGPSTDLETEIHYRLGLCREETGDHQAALASYRKALKTGDKRDDFRMLAVARTAAICEEKEDFNGALTAYRELIKYAEDEELVVAARERATQLESILK